MVAISSQPVLSATPDLPGEPVPLFQQFDEFSEGELRGILKRLPDIIPENEVGNLRWEAAADTFLELFANFTLHPMPQEIPARRVIEIGRVGELVYVTAEGGTSEDDLERLESAVESTRNRSSEELLAERNKKVFSGDVPHERGGAGVGVLTIAALASRPLKLSKEHLGSHAYRFSLTALI